MSRFYVILNPVAGKGNGARVKPAIEKKLNALGLKYSLVETERVGHATVLARQAALEDFDVVVAAGGDGTVNEVINGLMQLKESGKEPPVLAVLPIGRGNDFAFSMGIPVDPNASCQLLADDPQVKIDLGRVKSELFPEGLYFGNGVGVGFDAVVGFVAAKLPISGILSYLVAAIKTMSLYYNAPLIRLELDDETIETNSLMLSVMNGRRLGGSFMLAPNSSHNDGKYDIVIIQAIPRSQMIGAMGMVMKGTHAAHPAVKTLRSGSVKVTALDGTLPGHADGVTLCEAGREISVEMLPQALTIITGRLS